MPIHTSAKWILRTSEPMDHQPSVSYKCSMLMYVKYGILHIH